MKKYLKIFLSLLCALLFLLPVCAGCAPEGGGSGGEFIDYVSQLKLDLSSDTKKLKVSLRTLIDGDTTHFDAAESTSDTFVGGYIKARYLAVNTPESTGKIEKWGKTASNFTASKLSDAAAIMIESDNDQWNLDSTGERYTLWIWYIPAGADTSDVNNYRNLNVELLQNGYGRSSKTSQNRYGTIAESALHQAQDSNLKIYGNENDENFFDSEAEELSLKYLRFHLEEYNGHAVRVTGVVSGKYDNTVYIDEYDPTTGTYSGYGIAVYFGFETGRLLDVLSQGNYVSVRGKLTNFYGTWQLSDIKYDSLNPHSDTSTWLIESGIQPAFTERSVLDITGDGTITEVFELGEDEDGDLLTETLTLGCGEARSASSVKLTNLKVKSGYNTTNKESDDYGAMSLYCEDENGNEITIRTEPFQKKGEPIVNWSIYNGKTITVQGQVEYYSQEGVYQVHVHRQDFITVLS